MTKKKYGFTVKPIVMINMITNETITVGYSQRFTKSVLFDAVASGDHADFAMAAFDAIHDEDDTYDIAYSRETGLTLGEFLRVRFGDAISNSQ